MMRGGDAGLVAAWAALPEHYQPAWGIGKTHAKALRDCDDRLAVLLPLLETVPSGKTLRVLDVGCAQGYFTLAIADAMAKFGRKVELVGIDELADNVRFCKTLAAHHGLDVTFRCARFGGDFFEPASRTRYDVILALSVLHHVRKQQGEEAVTRAIEALRKHAHVSMLELAQPDEALPWVGDWTVPDDDRLEVYACRRRLARFATHLGQVQRPLYVCSDSLAWIGGKWIAFDRVLDRSHVGVSEAFAGQRRYFLGQDAVIKAFRGDGPYGAFNRSELEREADVLDALPDEPGRYPGVLARSDDGDVVWLARGVLPGKLLSDCIEDGDDVDRDAVARNLLVELDRLAAHGFHHSDLRCWNVVVDRGRVRLIDFGAMTTKRSPLHRVALAAVLREIADGKVRYAQPYYAALHPLSAYPASWHAMLRELLEVSQRSFDWHRLLAALDAAPAPRRMRRPLAPAADILAAISREQCVGFRRMDRHVIDLERRLAAARRELVDAARERDAVDASRREATAYSTSLLHELADARQYSEALDARVRSELADAAAERRAMETSLGESDVYARSLRQTLEESEAYAESLRGQLEREAADAASERAALEKARKDSEVHTASLAQALKQSQSYAESLRGQLEREAADAANERAALVASREEAEAHAASLKQALEQSQNYAESLRGQLEREGADAAAERAALETSREGAEAHAASLARALKQSQSYAESLRGQLEREAADAANERAALVASREEAEAHSASLAQALEQSQAYAESLRGQLEREATDAAVERAALEASRNEAASYADSLEQALEESQHYAESLRGQLEREATDAAVERAALEASRNEAASYADSLKQALEESQHYAQSLRGQLERESAEAVAERDALEAARNEAASYADSLQQALDRGVQDNRALTGKLDQSQRDNERLHARLVQMERRFRWLKTIWPRDADRPEKAT